MFVSRGVAKVVRVVPVIAALVGVMLLGQGAAANTVASSTIHFEGTLTDAGGGVFTGTIPATAGEYYVTGGPGQAISVAGGFDVYAKRTATAYVQGLVPDTYVIGADHDAYSQAGPWGWWYDPDVADWNKYALELTSNHWYLRYAPTNESPMSGIVIWNGNGTGCALESDLGTQQGGHGGSAAHGGGPQAWDVDWGWGVEVIPLEFSGFSLSVTPVGGGTYHVSLTPDQCDYNGSVGGTTELLVGGSVSPASAAEGSGSSAPLYPALAGIAAAAVALAAAGGWYARRRWMR